MSAGCQQMSAGFDAGFDPKTPQNLFAHIKEWITSSSGSFTTEQIDREFCLTSRADKNNRAKCLARCAEKKLVNKDKRIKGKYHIINSTLDMIDIFNVNETPFSLKLPFEIDRYVSIPKKAIIILAGSSNAGKTALILNTLKLNLSQEYKKLYLMSEMGSGEYVDRLRRFTDVEFKEWAKVSAAERTFDFNGAIEHHNPDGLTCIDFLEEVDGEYFKISTDIRNIYDSLGEGVSIIAIQKKSDSDYARGGQATAEKARLYMSVDLITVLDRSIICALKIIKNKRFVERNLQGHEIHFEITGGAEINPVSTWMRCDPGERERCKAIYENSTPTVSEGNAVYQFKTESGKIVGLNSSDHDKWAERFKPMNLHNILVRLSDSSFKKPWVNEKRWFFQISGIIEKEFRNFQHQAGGTN